MNSARGASSCSGKDLSLSAPCFCSGGGGGGGKLLYLLPKQPSNEIRFMAMVIIPISAFANRAYSCALAMHP